MQWTISICNYKKHLEIKYVIYETYNIIYKNLKFYENYQSYLNVKITNLYTYMF
jgi:hypothetical protein